MDRSLSNTSLLILLAGTLVLASSAGGAKRLKPPTRTMIYKYNKVAVVVAKSSPEEGKVLFKRKKKIWADMPGTVVARLDPAVIEELDWGGRYIVAYTEVRRNPLDRETPEVDPAGPKVVEISLVGPALLDDSPEARRMLEAAKSGEVDLGRAFLEDLMTLLSDPEPRTQRFAIAEFYLRAELQQNLRPEDVRPFRAQIASPVQYPEARALLLESFTKLPESIRGTWLAEDAREIVAEADTELDLASTWPLLVKTAILVLEQDGGSADAPVVARHFAANNPGVAKAALATLAVLDPDRAARRAREVLGRADLHASTRQAMESYLESYRRGDTGG